MALSPGTYEATTARRSAKITWDDPAPALERREKLSGRALLEATQRGELALPPSARLMDLAIEHVGDGCVVLESVPGELHQNSDGAIHGGYAATLLDGAMGAAVATLQGPGSVFVTLELSVHFIRPLLADSGPVRIEAKVIHAGARMATAEASLRLARTGKLMAHGTATLLRASPAA